MQRETADRPDYPDDTNFKPDWDRAHQAMQTETGLAASRLKHCRMPPLPMFWFRMINAGMYPGDAFIHAPAQQLLAWADLLTAARSAELLESPAACAWSVAVTALPKTRNSSQALVHLEKGRV